MKKEHPFGCSLILLWVKIFKVYSFAGHLKTICKDIFVWYSTHRQFEQTSKQCTAIHTVKGSMHSTSGKQQANSEQTQQKVQTTGKQRLHRSYVVCTHLFARSADFLYPTVFVVHRSLMQLLGLLSKF